jgi:hypothetical protein
VAANRDPGFRLAECGEELIELEHAGDIHVREGAIILDNAVVARGVFRQNTVIGAQARVAVGALSRTKSTSVFGRMSAMARLLMGT